ncbi:nucleotidyltransferase family protein [Roseofilum sp. SID3]|uniref:nucleotidyltransferase family protein n=1 Tax=unclassified Roseofilum TaxID=2620099 RepID=UPI0039A3C8AC
MKLAEQYHSTNIRGLGSVAKGKNTENSDIDFPIDPKPEQDLFDVIHLRRALQQLLTHKQTIGIGLIVTKRWTVHIS